MYHRWAFLFVGCRYDSLYEDAVRRRERHLESVRAIWLVSSEQLSIFLKECLWRSLGKQRKATTWYDSWRLSNGFASNLGELAKHRFCFFVVVVAVDFSRVFMVFVQGSPAWSHLPARYWPGQRRERPILKRNLFGDSLRPCMYIMPTPD